MELKIKGAFLTPVCMQDAARTTDPLDSDNRHLKTFTSKRKKTDSDYAQIDKLTWYLLLCLKNGKLIVPARWLRKAIQEAAKIEKNGKQWLRALKEIKDVELQFSEKKTLLQMYNDKKHHYRRPENRGGLITTVSPIFPDSWFETVIDFDESVLDEETVRRYLASELRLGALVHRGFGKVKIEVL